MNEEKSENNVLVYIDDSGVCEIKLVGQIKYGTTAQGFSEFVNKKVAEDSVKDVIVDLRECNFIDSTNIGTLAQIAKIQDRKNAKKPTLVYNEDSKVIEALEDVYVKQLYECRLNAETTPRNYQNIGNSKTSQYELSKIMYNGHKLLCELHNDNIKKFESAVKYLGESLSTMERKTTTIKITR